MPMNLIADRDDGNPVGRALLDQRVGDAGGERMDQRGAGGTFVLRALVALDAAVVAVFGLALLPGELDAVDAAVARVEQLEIIDHAGRDARAAGGVGADPVGVDRDELLFRLRCGLTGKCGRGNQRCRDGKAGACHGHLLLVWPNAGRV
jgi:hypothetical protein